MQCVLDMFRLLTFIFLVILNRGRCHNEAVFRKIKGKYLRDYVYTTMKTTNELHCTTHCSRDGSCVSVNFKISGRDRGLCELNSAKIKEASDGHNNKEFDYFEIVSRVGL